MLISLGIILSHTLLLNLVRRTISSKLPPDYKDVVADGLCAFELGLVSLEQGVIIDHYGLVIWSVLLVLFVAWQVVTWGDASPNPVDHLANLVNKPSGLLNVAAMMIGLAISYRYVCTMWNLGMTSLHSGRSIATAATSCHAPWNDLSQIALSEFLGSLILSIILPRCVLDNEQLINNDPTKVIRGLLVGLLVLLVVLLGMPWSGGMYNPALASHLLAGCSGISLTAHLIGYWMPPIFATWTLWIMEKRLSGVQSAKLTKQGLEKAANLPKMNKQQQFSPNIGKDKDL